MLKEDLSKSLSYGSHYSEVKEKVFVIQELLEQLRLGYIYIYPLAYVQNLKGLWLYPLAVIPQNMHKNTSNL